MGTWTYGDIKGNDMADEIVKKGAHLDTSNIEQLVDCPIQHLKTTIDKLCIARHNRQWQLSEGHLVSKSIWPTLDIHRTQYLLTLDKSSLKVLAGVITGHCRIGNFQSRISQNISDECRSCAAIDSIENISHLLCECPALCRRRQRYLGQFFFEELQELSSVNLQHLLGFIKSTRWF